jgi:hypothetical protein
MWSSGAEFGGDSGDSHNRPRLKGANSQPRSTHGDAKPLSPKGSSSSAPGNARGYGESNPQHTSPERAQPQAASRLVSPFQGLIWGLGRRAF